MPSMLTTIAARRAMTEAKRSALLIIDVQNDFCLGGSLAVANSDRVIDALNRYIDEAVATGVPIYASRDWHPAVTDHFQSYGGQWPVHCVAGTTGAQFHPDLRLPANTIVVTKGDRENSPGYSAFEGRTADGMSFREHLQKHRIARLVVGGLATDYCVRHSVLDALADGFATLVLEDAIAGVDVSAGDSARALDEMRQRGAVVASDERAIAETRGDR